MYKGEWNIMPEVKKNETRSDYVSRCIKVCTAEGLSQKAAVGKCEGMFSHKRSKRGKTILTGKK